MNKKSFHLAIIGGGPAGMMAALSAGTILDGSEIIIFEKNEYPGRKLLATGNGKCNFSHRDCSISEYGGEDPDFPREALSRMDPDETRELFEGIGLFSREDAEGRRYPYSEQATSVKESLETALWERGIRCLTGQTVTGIERASEPTGKGDFPPGYRFRITVAGGTAYNAKAVILATGGKAGAQFGSAGDGYTFARHLGHTIVSPRPALVQVLVDDKGFNRLKGVRAKGRVTLHTGTGPTISQRGEIQFTDTGLSGICIFDLSRHLIPGQKASVEIDLFPDLNEADLLKKLSKRKTSMPTRQAGTFLNGMIHQKLAEIYMDRLGVDEKLPVSQLGFEEIMSLGRLLKGVSLPITGTRGFQEAQITAGGVRTGEVDGITMESKLVPALYFAGEVLDVDGSCGGRNLQWAWSSGFVAGDAAARS